MVSCSLPLEMLSLIREARQMTHYKKRVHATGVNREAGEAFHNQIQTTKAEEDVPSKLKVGGIQLQAENFREDQEGCRYQAVSEIDPLHA